MSKYYDMSQEDVEWNKFLEIEFRKLKIKGVPITKATLPKDWKSKGTFHHKSSPRYKQANRIKKRIRKEYDEYFEKSERLEQELKLLGRKYGRCK